MSLASRGIRRYLQSQRSFSSAVTESPKITLAKNLLRLKEINSATDAEKLSTIANSPLPTVDIDNVPKEIEHLSAYLALSKLQASEEFKPDSSAWQNKGFSEFASEEVQRDETWPFFVGIM